MKNSRVPTDDTRDQVLEWLIEGSTYREISKATGLSLGLIHKIASDRNARVYENTKLKIAEAFHKRPGK